MLFCTIISFQTAINESNIGLTVFNDVCSSGRNTDDNISDYMENMIMNLTEYECDNEEYLE